MRFLITLLLAPIAFAQTGNVNPNIANTPAYSLGGSPLGSYALSDFDHINIYNGHLSFALPLYEVKGRGEAQFTIILPIDRMWSTVIPTGTSITEATDRRWYTTPPLYSPGLLMIREIAIGDASVSCGPPVNISHYTTTTSRMTFIAADGTETDFQDPSIGEPLENSCSGTGPSRGNTFVSTDGSAATFVSDSTIYDAPLEVTQSGMAQTPYPSGFLHWRDGVRYRIDNGFVTNITDRNGNETLFHYDQVQPNIGKLRSISDPLNRTVTFNQGIQNQRDDIVFTGFGGATRTISVYYDTLQNLLRSDQFIQTMHQLFPEFSSSGNSLYEPALPKTVTLPDGRQYSFSYDSYGELARVVLPTGGAVEYDYGAFGQNGTNVIGTFPNQIIYRRLTERRRYPDGFTLEGRTDYTPYFSGTDAAPGGWSTEVFESDYDSNNLLLAQTAHTFYGNTNVDPFHVTNPSGYSSWKIGRELTTQYYDGVSGALLRSENYAFAQFGTVGWWTDLADLAPPLNPRMTSVTTILDNGLTAQKTYAYDFFNNPVEVAEYDYGQNAPGPLIRLTHTDFINTDPNYISPSGAHLRSLPHQTLIYASNSPSAVPLSQTIYGYDETVLAGCPNVAGQYTGYDSSFRYRGNMTSVSRLLMSTNTWLITTHTYDVTGNITSTTDPVGNVTTSIYSDHFGPPDGNATENLPQSELNGLSSCAFRTGTIDPLGHTTASKFDFHLGAVTDDQDENGVVSDHYYNDPLDRPTKLVAAVGTASANQTLVTYSDSVHTILTQKDQTSFGDAAIQTALLYDGFGRTTEQRQYESNGGYISVLYGYDALGRLADVYNPYRQGDQHFATVTTFDALGRPISIVAPDSATTNISYSGNKKTTTDPAGVVKTIQADASGRISSVTEFPGTGTYVTNYFYDALDDLTWVNQPGAGQRFFYYDSLSRLYSAYNPETGTTAYTYNNNDNMTIKTDARSVSTTIAYDALNRPRTKTYSDGTPGVTFTYDNPAVPYSTGRLTSTSTNISSSAVTRFDPLGRVASSLQTTYGQQYPFSYGYNLAGSLISETYPTGRVISENRDAANRISAVFGLPPGGSLQPYATAVTYAAHGAINSLLLGNGLTERTGFNNRLQPTNISVGTAQTPTAVMGLGYSYQGAGQNNNNGNLLTQTITWPGVLGGLSQSYLYDGVNRLTEAYETQGTIPTWNQFYGYDQAGNRSVFSSSTYIPAPGLTPQGNGAFDPNTNRWVLAGYDAAGNMTSNPFQTLSYDAEDRQLSFVTSNVPAASYGYDGNNRRIVKTFGGFPTVYVYDIFGRLTAEYSAQTNSSSMTSYLSADYLGSIRAVTDGAGNVRSRHDYLPFGEEITINLGSRLSVPGYGAADNVSQRFTGKERDLESGLDYSKARYYSSPAGRFSAADIPLDDQLTMDPQSWDLYSYARNNPGTFVDRTGRSAISAFDQGVRRFGSAAVSMGEDFSSQATNGIDTVALSFALSGESIGSAVFPLGEIASRYTFGLVGIEGPSHFFTKGEALSDKLETATASELLKTMASGLHFPEQEDVLASNSSDLVKTVDISNAIATLIDLPKDVGEIGKLQKTINVESMLGRSTKLTALDQLWKIVNVLQSSRDSFSTLLLGSAPQR